MNWQPPLPQSSNSITSYPATEWIFTHLGSFNNTFYFYSLESSRLEWWTHGVGESKKQTHTYFRKFDRTICFVQGTWKVSNLKRLAYVGKKHNYYFYVYLKRKKTSESYCTHAREMFTCDHLVTVQTWQKKFSLLRPIQLSTLISVVDGGLKSIYSECPVVWWWVTTRLLNLNWLQLLTNNNAFSVSVQAERFQPGREGTWPAFLPE